MAHFSSCAAAVVSLALVSACGLAGTQIDYRELNPSYTHQNFDTYLRGRDTHVIVRGDTFDLAPGAFGDLVTAAMQGQNEGGRTNFTTRPTDAEPNFRVVMAFNVASYTGGLCAAEDFKPSNANGMTTLQAAWCWEGRAESYLSARTRARNPNDPEFKQLVAAVTRGLFPRHMDKILIDDDDNGDDGDGLP